MKERQLLTKWWREQQQSIFAVIAMGGMGKSALTWAWLRRDVLGKPLPDAKECPTDALVRVPERDRPDGVLWWTFYDTGSSFTAFVNEALTYISRGEANPNELDSLHEKVQQLWHLLQQGRFLIVMDGFERELRGYRRLDAVYQSEDVDDKDKDFSSCVERYAAKFLEDVANIPMSSRVLLTSRLLPQELNDLAGCHSYTLESLDPNDAVGFFQAQGIKGTPERIKEVCEPYGYYPLALRLLAGYIVKHPRKPKRLEVAPEYDPVADREERAYRILELSYHAASPNSRTLLSQIAAFRSAVKNEENQDIRPEIDDGMIRSQLIIFLGESYSALGKPKKALECFKEGKFLDKQNKDLESYVVTLRDICDVESLMGKLKNANTTICQSIKLYQKFRDWYREADGYQVLGEFQKSDRNLKYSIRKDEKIKDLQGICLSQAYRARSLLIRGELDR